MIFCSNCGKENPPNTEKYVFCNTNLQLEDKAVLGNQVALTFNKKTIVIGVSIVLALILLIVVLLGNRVPNVIGVEENSAKDILIGKGYSPVIVYENDNSQPAGCVVGTNPGYGSRLGNGGQVTMYVSAGKASASSSVLHWHHVTGSQDDDYNFTNPYVKNNYLYLEAEMRLETNYTVLLRGFGTASINDTFDKTVPLEYEYEKATVVKGEYQKVTIRIPLADLDEQRPTTIYLRLATYVAGRNEDVRLELDMTW